MADPLPLRAVVGPAVRRIREGAGARQEDVSAVAYGYGLRWHRATVGDIEAGNKPVGVETLALLVGILTHVARRHITLSDLLDPTAHITLSDGVVMTGRALADVLADRRPPPDQVIRAEQALPEHTRPTAVDRRVARQLGVTPQAAQALAVELLGDGFASVRNRLAHEFDPQASVDRRRGLRARASTLLISQMRAALAQAAPEVTRNDTTEEAWT